MYDTPFHDLQQLRDTRGTAEMLRELTDKLRTDRQWHSLFDARLLAKKHELKLPLSRPASLDDVPDEHRAAVQETYLSAAREAGMGLLDDGDLTGAWMYFQVAREPGPMAAALEKLPDRFDDPRFDTLVRIALFEKVHPEKGVRMLLATCGTCNTITALDQALPHLEPAQRDGCARLLVDHLYQELHENLESVIAVKEGASSARITDSLRELIHGRTWLFENGSYHVDVSHLQAVIRFGRSVESGREQWTKARDLATYGAALHRELQPSGEPPFADFFTANIHYFNILLDEERDAGLSYFREQLTSEPDPADQAPAAYVLTDLLTRCGRLDDAIEMAAQHLLEVNDELRQSFDELCARAGRWDMLERVARQRGDLVGFAAALARRGGESGGH